MLSSKQTSNLIINPCCTPSHPKVTQGSICRRAEGD